MVMENLQKENEPKVDLKVRSVMVSQSTLIDSWILGEKSAVLWIKPKISEQ